MPERMPYIVSEDVSDRIPVGAVYSKVLGFKLPKIDHV